MPQLEGSNPEKTLPTCKKAADLEQFVAFPSKNCQYLQFWLVQINHQHSWGKIPVEDCDLSFPWPRRVLDWYFFCSQHVQIADEKWLTLHWQKTSESDSLQGRKLKIKDWLCENMCSFLSLKKPKPVVLHHSERSGLASRCLSVDSLAFCRMSTLGDKKS